MTGQISAALMGGLISERFPFFAGYKPNSYILMSEYQITNILNLTLPNNLFVHNFNVYEDLPIQEFGVRTGSAGGAGQLVKFGIWANNPAIGNATGLPIISTNTGQDFSVANTNRFVSATTILRRGNYWFGFNYSTNTGNGIGLNNNFNRQIPIDVAPSTTTAVVAQSVAIPYATDISTVDLTGATFSPVVNSTCILALFIRRQP